MAVEGSLFPVSGYDTGTTLSYPMLAIGDETGAIYLMIEKQRGVCLISDSSGNIGVGSVQTAGGFTPLGVAESVILTQVLGEQR